MGLEIDLGNDDETDNDDFDLDAGANRLQNFPEFNLANTYWDDVTGQLHIRYRVYSLPVGGFVTYPLTVDFFMHDPWQTPGDEARAFLGSDTYVEAEGAGWKDIVLTPPAGTFDPNALGFEFGGLRATATDSTGNTSELSRQNVPVPEPGMPLMLAAGGVAFGLLGRRARRA